MILGRSRRAANEAVIDRLYAAVVAASRQPSLYRDIGIPDTFEGRFESLTLHAVLIVRRLKALEAPGPDIAQHVVDTMFRHFDRTLREMGVGDTSVPKRMKSLAEAFLGRSKAYDEALRDETGEDLVAALQRNVCRDEGNAGALARYVTAGVAVLATLPLAAFVDGKLACPDPATFVKEVAT